MAITRIDKLPSGCADPSQLQAGDILIFDIYPTGIGANITTVGQRLLETDGGHESSVHTALVVEIDGKLKITHLRGSGYFVEDASVIYGTTHIYRPIVHQKEIAASLNKFISQNMNQLKHYLSWRSATAASAFVGNLFNAVGINETQVKTQPVTDTTEMPEDVRALSSWSICSKFVPECYQIACNELSKKDKDHHDYKHDLMNITTTTLPKTLQAYLYRNSNYQYLIMPRTGARGKIVENLRKIIQQEIARMEQSKDSRVIAKKNALIEKLKAFDAKCIESKSSSTDAKQDFDQAMLLLKNIVPVLNINTGMITKTPNSLIHVMNYAQTVGLYKSYFLDNYIYPEHGNDLSEISKTAYGYNDEQARIYSNSRKLGYSDEEARFESNPNPTFSEWYNLSPRRNLAATVTVLPFFLSSLPYGLARIEKVKEQHTQHGEKKPQPSPK